jgi:bifunctional DNA primase/polymerase-like protein
MLVEGNVGVGCRASGVVGLDLDRRAGVDGVAGFAGLCERHDVAWPNTLTVATPSGGRHLYFRAGGRRILSLSGDRCRLGAGIDVRGPGARSGGYLVGPGSTVSGGSYRVSDDLAIGELPLWLADLLPQASLSVAGPRSIVHWSSSRAR